MKFMIWALTILQLAYLTSGIFFPGQGTKFILRNNLDLMVYIFHMLLMGFIFFKTWSSPLIPKKRKVDFTWMIVILGVIGMHLWLKKMKQYASN